MVTAFAILCISYWMTIPLSRKGRILRIVEDGCEYEILRDGRILEYVHIAWGGEEPPPLLILFFPGFGLTARYVEDLLRGKFLPYDFLSISMPGFGGSDRDVREDGGTVMSFLHDVEALLRRLDLHERRIVVVGNSVGGLIANAFACGVNHTLNVVQVQFLCPAAPPHELDKSPLPFSNVESRVHRLLIHMIAPVLFRFPRFAYYLHEGTDDCLDWGKEEPDRLDALVEDARRAGSFGTRGYYDNLRMVLQPLGFECDQPDPEIHLQFVFAQQDRACPGNHRLWYQRRYGLQEEGDYHWVEGGHCICQKEFSRFLVMGINELQRKNT